MAHAVSVHPVLTRIGHFFEHALAIAIGFVMMIVGLGLGVTMVMLPLGLAIGLLGVAVFIGGIFGQIDG